MFSEPKVVLPGPSAVVPVESDDTAEAQPSGECPLEAVPVEVTLEASAARLKKRARDGTSLADSSTTEGARKKRKGKK